MDETRVPEVTRGYRVVAWIVAVLIGAAVGVGLGLLTQQVWTGIIGGAAAVALIGLSIVFAARREGRGTIEGAPPWTGDAGVRHHGGGSL
ncbi:MULTISPECIES: hypothetical protein [unclassified Microbacterium]|uniref:hypothetical protein n=1 Tax=unclassified Microbacterium TaxID=2609290 RepID=UPI000EA84CAF|nr:MULTISPECIES: hypothetical protein [unclassified Microbacterium]MBT2483525.1 hypothetical protein [Microbacterium sp. ISL-108]